MLDLMLFKIDVFSKHFTRNLMDTNLFQWKSTFHEIYRWVPVIWGFLLTHFQASVGLFFWEYQIDNLITRVFKGKNNQKLCLSFCHSLVSHLTSFFCTIYCIEFQFFISYSIPQTFTVYQTLAICLLAIFFGKFFTGLPLTIFCIFS